MANKVRHLLGISGGKDSAALAIYLHQKYPSLPLEYYWCDTGKELDETYELIDKLKACMGIEVVPLRGAEGSHHQEPFDHFIEQYGGFLPSSTARWCTKKLKLDPFEKFVGTDPVVSYVGIRGDEDREGYISKKSNIQSIFPFRKNIWSEDVIKRVLANGSIEELQDYYSDLLSGGHLDRVEEVVQRKLSMGYNQKRKLNDLLDLGIQEFNRVVFRFLRSLEIPLAMEEDFPLLDNEDNLVREDIFRILRESGVGVPQYYEKLEYEVNGKKGYYARSRSGCFFCFFQQKIEWVWLYEQHPELFAKAIEYEKDGYTWMQDETLEELSRPERIMQIKEDQIKRSQKEANRSGNTLLDILEEEGEGCAACFI